jgi:hypothetical protein
MTGRTGTGFFTSVLDLNTLLQRSITDRRARLGLDNSTFRANFLMR